MLNYMKYILFFLTYFVFATLAYGQNLQVGGRVFSESHQPLPGATVKLAGSNSVTHTDVKGYFKLLVPGRTGKLQVTFVGYENLEIPVTDSVALAAITMSPVRTGMTEVFVYSGYQQLSKSNTTGSYGQVSKELLERSVSTDIISRLDGIIPSLAFDNRATDQQNISIRGRSTILSNNAPLIVVDNFPYDGDLHNINPNDVENITILKDAAAAAIWGARAGNGVIVITTKRGKFNQANNITFNSNWTIGNKPDLFYDPSFLNAAEFISVEQQLFGQGFYSADENAPNKPVLPPAVELMIAQRDGQITSADLNEKLDALRKHDVRNDLMKYFYRKSFRQQYSLSVDGGGEKYNYIVSGGYDDNRSNLVGNKDNRYTFHAVNNFRPVKDLLIGSDISYTSTKSTANNPGYKAINSGSGKATIYPYAQLADAAGNPLAVAKDHPLSFTNDAINQGNLDWQYKPLQEISLADNITQLKDIRLKFNTRYTILPGFSAEALYQYENSTQQGNFLYIKDTYYARNLINEYEQPGAQYAVPLGGIRDTQLGTLNSQSGRFQVNYNHTLWGTDQLAVVAGAEVRNIHSQSRSNRLYGYDHTILVNQPVDYLSYFTLNPGGDSGTVPYIANQTDMTDRYVSEYVSASYNYAERYYLSASARKDASNLFGVNANQKGVPLYSVGTAWQLSKEAFYHLEWLPFLKLRATYGYTGNVNKAITAYTTALYDTDLVTGLPNSLIFTPPNPDLQWEKVRTINLGLDFETRGRRMSGSLEYFAKKGTSQLGSVALDPTTGFFISNRYSYFLNSSAIAGHGFDVELNTINTKGLVGWQTRMLFSYAVDEVTGYQFQNPVNDYLSPNSPPLLGKPVLGIYSYKWAGLDNNGDPMVYLNSAPSKDYAAIAAKATIKDLVYNGPALPPVFGSLMNTITYKQFSLSANITYKFGYYFHRSSISYSNLINNWIGHQDFSKRWQKPGDEKITNVPALSLDANANRDAAYINSTALVDKGDNIRLQDIQLSYTVIHFKNSHFPFRELTVYGYANNLGILWRANKDGLDPDYVYGNSAIKPVKNFSLGFRANF